MACCDTKALPAAECREKSAGLYEDAIDQHAYIHLTRSNAIQLALGGIGNGYRAHKWIAESDTLRT